MTLAGHLTARVVARASDDYQQGATAAAPRSTLTQASLGLAWIGMPRLDTDAKGVGSNDILDGWATACNALA